MAATQLPNSDDDLIARIRAGDARAFEELFRTYYEGLCVFAARLVGSDGMAEDVVQDVLLRIWQRHERWEVAGSIPSYLYAAVRNRALNHLRHLRRKQRWRHAAETEAELLIESVEGVSADAAVRSGELADAIERAIQRLSPRCRQAFLLRRQHHLSYAEIARVMEVAPKTVEIQIGTALKSLRKQLAEWL
jgi:RNA polymerase sigma-70 factor (ECF subfamily)